MCGVVWRGAARGTRAARLGVGHGRAVRGRAAVRAGRAGAARRLGLRRRLRDLPLLLGGSAVLW